MIYFVRNVANIYFTLFVYSNKHLMRLIFTITTETNNVLKTPKLRIVQQVLPAKCKAIYVVL